MHPDIAFGERAQNGVDKRMQGDVGVGMSRHAAPIRDTDARKHDVIAIAEGVHVKAVSGAHVRKRRHAQRFGAGKVCQP